MVQVFTGYRTDVATNIGADSVQGRWGFRLSDAVFYRICTNSAHDDARAPCLCGCIESLASMGGMTKQEVAMAPKGFFAPSFLGAGVLGRCSGLYLCG